MENFFRTWKIKEVEKVHKELAKDYINLNADYDRLLSWYNEAEDMIEELREELGYEGPVIYKNENEEIKGENKMIIKKKKEITMEEFLHMLVDKGVLEGLTFNRYNGEWFDRHSTVNIELLTSKKDFPKFEIHGGADMDSKVTLIEEIEIDEDTEFERILEVNKSGAINTFYDTTIKEQLWYGSSEYHITIDDKLVKIWDKEKGMVE